MLEVESCHLFQYAFAVSVSVAVDSVVSVAVVVSVVSVAAAGAGAVVDLPWKMKNPKAYTCLQNTFLFPWV